MFQWFTSLLASFFCHVWVRDYIWRDNNNVCHDGYWAAPPAFGRHWVEGALEKRRGGWVWITGHWKR